MSDFRSSLRENGLLSHPLRWAVLVSGLFVLVIVGGFFAVALWSIGERVAREPEPEPELGQEQRPVEPPPRVPVDPAPVEPDVAAPPPALMPAPDLEAIGAGGDGPGDSPPETADPEAVELGLSDSDVAMRASTDPLDVWAREMATVVDAPPLALRAYANAESRLRAEQPACGISWTMLIGIGRVESDHGRFAGAELGNDSRPSIPIYGVPLDGSSGVLAIPDTDGGELDGDDVWDRAMGPMQFLPETWELFGRDADGDGVADPQRLDDAALSAATYLCAADRDLTSGPGWWSAVFSYNNSVDYGQRVFGLAETYAGYVPEEP
ncbi:lytic transglycosylase domain-containing protein [Actinoalloteichus fjordicus]|uniref:Transglycosylase SLT domain n=1 Tax=Actinoalloteichus fjordicus TaxID=1612552 RepID=A0AAC9LAL2_9PSEU|nr:lytic murein transglycosylase [Actinoalloteichus fjordicus]APU12824.1 Transglycosylase SLT domain [Actinoalloteichus fjordicus]